MNTLFSVTVLLVVCGVFAAAYPTMETKSIISETEDSLLIRIPKSIFLETIDDQEDEQSTLHRNRRSAQQQDPKVTVNGQVTHTPKQ